MLVVSNVKIIYANKQRFSSTYLVLFYFKFLGAFFLQPLFQSKLASLLRPVGCNSPKCRFIVVGPDWPLRFMHFGCKKWGDYCCEWPPWPVFIPLLGYVSQNRYAVTRFPYKPTMIFIGYSGVYVHSGVCLHVPEKVVAIKKAEMRSPSRLGSLLPLCQIAQGMLEVNMFLHSLLKTIHTIRINHDDVNVATILFEECRCTSYWLI